jgi:hypothetical protein
VCLLEELNFYLQQLPHALPLTIPRCVRVCVCVCVCGGVCFFVYVIFHISCYFYIYYRATRCGIPVHYHNHRAYDALKAPQKLSLPSPSTLALTLMHRRCVCANMCIVSQYMHSSLARSLALARSLTLSLSFHRVGVFQPPPPSLCVNCLSHFTVSDSLFIRCTSSRLFKQF